MNSTEHRAKAAEIRRLAAAANSHELREQYLAMARDWERLAADAENRERRAEPQARRG